MKRGQAGNIATLISLIALFMLVYILLLPQEARDDLLGREDGVPRHILDDDGEIDTLFSKEIGEVSPLRQSRGVLHTLAGVNLFSDVESEIVTLANNIRVSKGLVSENSQDLAFALDFPQDVLSAEVYTIVDSGSGNLIAELNGAEIFNSNIPDNSQEIIELPLVYLNDINTFTLRASSPGVLGTNIYDLKEVRLRKQVEVKNRRSSRVISVPATELRDLQNAILSFSIFCSQDERDLLNIKVNGGNVYSDVPFCNLRRTEIEIDSSFINSGSNDIVFESDGDYVVEEVEWQSLLRGERASEYAFTIDGSDYNDVRRGEGDVLLIFEFALSDDRKLFDFYINEEKFEIDTLDSTKIFTISDFLERGSNLIRLRPRNSFEIIEMRVELD